VENVFLYDFVDDGTDPNETEMHFGLLLHDLESKPSWAAFKFMAQTLAGSDFVESSSAGSAVVLRFERPDGAVIRVAWDGCVEVRNRSMENSRGTLAVLPASDSATAYDLYGKPVALDVNDSGLSLEVGGEPCYIVYWPES